MPTVGLILGSISDREIGDKIYQLLVKFDLKVEYNVISAHRCPEELENYLEKSKAEIFIAVAGLSAALPGVIASKTLKPVIGVPRNVQLMGLDSLLTIVQMPPGIPVACVGIDNATNAAILAVIILSIKYPELKEKLRKYREEGKKKAFKKLS